jgi:hypothetical protein
VPDLHPATGEIELGQANISTTSGYHMRDPAAPAGSSSIGEWCFFTMRTTKLATLGKAVRAGVNPPHRSIGRVTPSTMALRSRSCRRR